MLNRELLFLPTAELATLVHVLLIIPRKLSIVLEKMKDDHSQTKVSYLCQCWQMSKSCQLIQDSATR